MFLGYWHNAICDIHPLTIINEVQTAIIQFDQCRPDKGHNGDLPLLFPAKSFSWGELRLHRQGRV
jgi:hypothetical protein